MCHPTSIRGPLRLIGHTESSRAAYIPPNFVTERFEMSLCSFGPGISGIQRRDAPRLEGPSIKGHHSHHSHLSQPISTHDKAKPHFT